MAKQSELVIVTGFKELDTKLRNMPAALQRKFVRGGLRKATNRVVKAAKTIIRNEAFDTGAFESSLKTAALKRRRTRVGYAAFTKTSAMYEKREMKVAKRNLKRGFLSKVPKRFFYPAVIEFGSPRHKAIKPMRRALYGNDSELRAYFEQDVKQFIREQKVTTKL